MLVSTMKPTVVRWRGKAAAHLSLSAGEGDVDEAAGVCESLLRAALGLLLLLLWLDLQRRESKSAFGPQIKYFSFPFQSPHIFSIRRVPSKFRRLFAGASVSYFRSPFSSTAEETFSQVRANCQVADFFILARRSPSSFKTRL
jgi:hypothetical protein